MTTVDPSSDAGWFGGFGGAPMRGGGNFLAAGVYDIEINAFLRKVSQKPGSTGNQLAIVEGTILSTVNAFPADPAGGYLASNNAGEKISWIQDTVKHHQTAFGNLKMFLLACLNYRSIEAAVQAGKEMPALILETALTAEQWQGALLLATRPPGFWAKGIRLRAQVGRTVTQQKKAICPVQSWIPIVPSTGRPFGA